MIIGCMVNALINLVAPLSSSLVFISVSLLSTFVGFLPIITLSILSKLSPQNVQGSIMGLNESLLNIGTVVGPLFCSFTASIDHKIPFFTASILLFGLMYKVQSMTEFNQTEKEASLKKSD
jgi:MFS family permease